MPGSRRWKDCMEVQFRTSVQHLQLFWIIIIIKKRLNRVGFEPTNLSEHHKISLSSSLRFMSSNSLALRRTWFSRSCTRFNMLLWKQASLLWRQDALSWQRDPRASVADGWVRSRICSFSWYWWCSSDVIWNLRERESRDCWEFNSGRMTSSWLLKTTLTELNKV